MAQFFLRRRMQIEELLLANLRVRRLITVSMLTPGNREYTCFNGNAVRLLTNITNVPEITILKPCLSAIKQNHIVYL